MIGRYLLSVRANVSPEREAEFNDWYNNDHLPKMQKFPGVVSAKRYQAIVSGDEYNYLAVYELDSEESLQALMASDFLKQMIAEYNEAFGAHSRRVRTAWRQIYP